MYDAAVSGCPQNFHYLEQPYNLCYKSFPMNLRRQSASMYCRALDPRAHLVVINSEHEQEVLAEGLRQIARK